MKARRSSSRHQRRPSVHYRDVVDALRAEMLSGKCPPGQRLPTSIELRRRFRTTPVTIHRAIQQLSVDGFVQTRRRAGMFVVDHPPHLCRYGIAFAHKKGDAATLFQDAIAAAAENISSRDPRRQFSFYYEMDGHTDREGYRALTADLRARRLAGLLFATHPGPLLGSPLLARDGVPRIAITSDSRIAALDVSIYGVNGNAFMDRALTLASQAGTKRIAVLWHTDQKSNWQPEIDGVIKSAAANGLDLIRRHVQVPALRDPASIYHCVYSLLDDAPERRPETLIISDDNLVEEATRAIVQTGVRVPQELKVIAHCNYPTLPPAAVPVVRLGPDIRAMLEQCVVILDGLRSGQKAQATAFVPPLLETELAHHEQSPESSERPLVAARG